METNLSFSPEEPRKPSKPKSTPVFTRAPVEPMKLTEADLANIVITVEEIGPALAKKYLICNSRNRDQRSKWIADLAGRMARGEWVFTAETVSFDEDGYLIDGQHRLEAILMSGVTLQMLVARGFPRKAFDVIDRGKRRNDRDLLGGSEKHTQVVSFITREVFQNGKYTENTADQLRLVEGVIGDLVDELLSYAPSSTKIFSSVPVKAAAVARMLQGKDKEYIKELYKGLTCNNTNGNPIGQAFIGHKAANHLNTNDWPTNYAMAFKVFDPKNKDKSKLSMGKAEKSRTLAEIAKVLRLYITLASKDK